MSKVCKHCPWKTQPLHTEFRVKSVSPALLLPCPCPGQAALRVASEDAHREPSCMMGAVRPGVSAYLTSNF